MAEEFSKQTNFPIRVKLAAQPLPKNSTFTVQTPTAVATVRGTEYRTTFIEGRAEVFNVSASKVFVYGVKADGSVDNKQMFALEQFKKTQVAKAGASPEAPQAFSADDRTRMDSIQSVIQTKIQEVEKSGRISTIQSIEEMEAAAGSKLEVNESDESRVVDLRRRSFRSS